jgi:uncharacterized protein
MYIIAFGLLVIGGLNWLLVGLLGWDIGQFFGGTEALISRVIYIVIGLAAIIAIFTRKQACKNCCKNSSSESTNTPSNPTMPPM